MIVTAPDGTTYRITVEWGNVRAVEADPLPGELHFGSTNGPRYLVFPRDSESSDPADRIEQRLQVNNYGQVSVGPTDAAPPLDPDDLVVTDLNVVWTKLPDTPDTVDDDDMYEVTISWTPPVLGEGHNYEGVGITGFGDPYGTALPPEVTSFSLNATGGTAMEVTVVAQATSPGGDPYFTMGTPVTFPPFTLPAPTAVYGAPRNVQVSTKVHPQNSDYFQVIATWDAPEGPAPAFYRITKDGENYAMAYSNSYDQYYGPARETIDGFGVRAVYGSNYSKLSAIVPWPGQPFVLGMPGDAGSGGAGFYDNFERFDKATSLQPPWVAHTTKGYQAGQQSVWGIKRGQAYQSSGLYYASTTVPGDSTTGFVEFQPGELGNAIGEGGVVIRADSTGAGIAIIYNGYGSNNNGTGNKVVAYNTSAYNSSTGFPVLGWFPEWAPGDLVRIEWTPTQISYSRNAETPTVLTSSVLSGNTRRGLVSSLAGTLFRNFRTDTLPAGTEVTDHSIIIHQTPSPTAAVGSPYPGRAISGNGSLTFDNRYFPDQASPIGGLDYTHLSHAAWFGFKAAQAATVTVDTIGTSGGTDNDTYLRVFDDRSGSDISQLTLVAKHDSLNDGGPQTLTFETVPGHTYYALITQWGSYNMADRYSTAAKFNWQLGTVTEEVTFG